MIKLACGCGKKLSVPDKYAGKWVRCPQCKRPVRVPPAPPLAELPVVLGGVEQQSVWVPLSPVTASAMAAMPEPKKRTFWRDPVVVIGTAVPAVILVAFFGYLYQQRAARLSAERVYAIKAGADRSYQAGDVVAAYKAYREVEEEYQRHPTPDGQVRAVVRDSREAVKTLAPLSEAKIKEEQVAKREKEEADKKKAEHDAEMDRLEKFTADVVGGAWYTNRLQNAVRMRGIDVYLLERSLPKRDIAAVLREACKVAATNKDLFEGVSRTLTGPGKDEVAWIGAAAGRAEENLRHMDTFGDSDKVGVYTNDVLLNLHYALAGRTRAIILGDTRWRGLVERLQLAKATTDIDGRYRMSAVRGGEYYLYTFYYNDSLAMEWLVPIKIDRPGVMTFDLHENNALLVANGPDAK